MAACIRGPRSVQDPVDSLHKSNNVQYKSIIQAITSRQPSNSTFLSTLDGLLAFIQIAPGWAITHLVEYFMSHTSSWVARFLFTSLVYEYAY
ncbi:hypothetical protein J6590_006830 [Homalodisca vitripennis]|nr:hypothetical protein J6590_006830 [Homalodisca vitripennis]